ncbi:MAG: hydrogenase formation protein HypD [Planctomycetota bacterium]
MRSRNITSESELSIEKIRQVCREMESLSIMEVCGTHTVALFRSGIRSVLPSNVRLISGPGCPVCVTSQGYIDAAIELAGRPDVTLCTYGDMLRVPGREGSLERHRARGAGIRVCYSVRDALIYAESHPSEQVIFLAVGFETTAPASALAVLEAADRGVENFTLLMGHKRVMPAMKALLSGGEIPVHGFLLPGHVSVIIGSDVYQDLVKIHGKACAVAGFEPEGILDGILKIACQVAEGRPRVENVYRIAVKPEGNPHALECLDRVFKACDTEWRGMGILPESGLELHSGFDSFDAAKRFDLIMGNDYDPPGCCCGEVIQGKTDPMDCRLFGEACTFEHPVGPCMVSSEGTCAAWYRYGPRKQ